MKPVFALLLAFAASAAIADEVAAAPPWLPADPGRGACRATKSGGELANAALRYAVASESGTLKRHGRGTPSRGNLHAKTGTTNTVAALGGYVTAKNGEVLAFSLLYNGNDRGNAKAAMDQIGATMAEFVRQ